MTDEALERQRQILVMLEDLFEQKRNILVAKGAGELAETW